MTFSSGMVGTQSVELLWVPMVPRQGLEPWTSALPRMRSTTELRRQLRSAPLSQSRAAGEA